MKVVFNIIIGFLLLLSVIILISIFCLGTYDVLSSVIGYFSNADFLIKSKHIIDRVPDAFCIIVLLVFISFLLFIYIKQNFVFHFVNDSYNTIKGSIKNVFSILDYKDFIILLIPFLASIYFALTIPVSYDEAITYNLFTSKPFFYAAIFYPYPNNHVLHSLITNLFDILPFGSALFKMRIPAILANIFTWIIALSFFKKYFSNKIGILAVGCCSVFWLTIYYSFMSRGYAFMVLCVVICFYLIFNILKNNRKKDWVYYTIFSVLGAYTLPSFLYPLATLNLLILIFNVKLFKRLFIANVLIGVCTAIAYLPIILVDGIDALINNNFVQKIDRVQILEGILLFYRGALYQIIGILHYGNHSYVDYLWIIFLLPIFSVLKNRKMMIFWIVLLVTPFLLVFIQAVNPFYRTFLYYNFFIVFLFFVSLKKYINHILINFIFLFVIIVQLAFVYHFNKQIPIREGFNTDVNRVVSLFFKDDQKILFPCIASANYIFEAKTRNLEDQVYFYENEKASADTIVGYKYVIIGKNRDLTQFKEVFFSSEHQNIYKYD